MTLETANYIIRYFSSFMSDIEKRAFKHNSSVIKTKGNDNEASLIKVYKKRDWLTNDPSVLELLKNGFEEFTISTAKRILTENEKKVFLNFCSRCNGLARTPKAQQCHHCGFSWHKEE